ncbi:hypothetical protein GCM10010420_01260 [Streptomyces glaucosporus]|uniref:Uncharacterized protein n=1 Tax=Streptomyces glaucosporus TaxID=284044 RepID=A0ABN3HLU2_9ACTN
MDHETGRPAETARLAEALRREADALRPGPPPVDAVLREGRRRRRQRHRALAGTAAAAVLGCLAGALLLPSGPPAGPAAPPAASTVSPAPSPPPAPVPGVRVVRPYEPVEIGQGALLGLLPEGRQNYVVDWSPEGFRESVRQARKAVGDGIRPNSLSGGISFSPDRGVLYTGAWRTDTEPARITVTAAGRTWEAGLVSLPDDPGWGVYHVDAGRLGPDETSATVTVYGPDGTVLARLDTTSPAP